METWFWNVFGIEERPEFIHHGLLSLESGTLSKSTARRKMQRGELEGWEDPRTWSIQSLKKRGFKPASIRQFIRELGVSLADNKMPLKILYSINRSNIDDESNRYACILNAKAITIEGKDAFKTEVPKHPTLNRGTRTFTMGPNLLIEQKDYETLQAKRKIRLQHLCNIEYEDGT
ncbi:MAG: glutamate--tRNA ligase, partial [Candidatus Korarchaeota archaeon]|nr:glutamate--tRNA ligase [Candidatus Korarchaeota archaeon]